AIVLVVGYMCKDRIKEGTRRILQIYMSRFLPDRTTRLVDPVTQDHVGGCRDQIDYATVAPVPEELLRLRQHHDTPAAPTGDAHPKCSGCQVVRLVLDPHRIKRMLRFDVPRAVVPV